MSRGNLYTGIGIIVELGVQVPELGSSVSLGQSPVHGIQGHPLLNPVLIPSIATTALRCAEDSSDGSLVELNQLRNSAELHAVMIDHVGKPHLERADRKHLHSLLGRGRRSMIGITERLLACKVGNRSLTH